MQMKFRVRISIHYDCKNLGKSNCCMPPADVQRFQEVSSRKIKSIAPPHCWICGLLTACAARYNSDPNPLDIATPGVDRAVTPGKKLGLSLLKVYDIVPTR